MRRKDDEQMKNHLPVLAAALAMCGLLFFIYGGLDVVPALQKGMAWQEAQSNVSLSMLLTCLVCLFMGRFLLLYEDRIGKKLVKARLVFLVVLALAVVVVAVLPIGRSYILTTVPSAALIIGALLLWAITGLSVLMTFEEEEE